jgi:superfamily II DNA/RNA helicase
VQELKIRLAITKLTVAQRLSIPHLLRRKDILLKSPTGTGKTLAYAVPIMQHLLSAKTKVSTWLRELLLPVHFPPP